MRRKLSIAKFQWFKECSFERVARNQSGHVHYQDQKLDKMKHFHYLKMDALPNVPNLSTEFCVHHSKMVNLLISNGVRRSTQTSTILIEHAVCIEQLRLPTCFLRVLIMRSSIDLLCNVLELHQSSIGTRSLLTALKVNTMKKNDCDCVPVAHTFRRNTSMQ